MANPGYTVTFTTEERELLLTVIQQGAVMLAGDGTGDGRVTYNTLLSLIEMRDKIEDAVKCYS